MADGNTTDVWAERERSRAAERARVLAHVRSRLEAARTLLAGEGCNEAWLVGSFARGDPLPESDVDLIAGGLTPPTRARLWWELGRLFGREVDLAEAERIPPERLAMVLADGIRLLP